jgi:hypothetical protein
LQWLKWRANTNMATNITASLQAHDIFPLRRINCDLLPSLWWKFWLCSSGLIVHIQSLCTCTRRVLECAERAQSHTYKHVRWYKWPVSLACRGHFQHLLKCNYRTFIVTPILTWIQLPTGAQRLLTHHVLLCNSISGYQHFRETCGLHLQTT